MTGITYVVGDATQSIGEGRKVICHVCNDIGAWGSGFVLALSARWAAPEAEYRRWFRGEGMLGRVGALHKVPFVSGEAELGNIQVVEVEEQSVYVCNMIAQKLYRPRPGDAPIRYCALAKCLEDLEFFAHELEASVHMPRIGCGLAGGTWDKVEPLILEELVDFGVPVFVYDLPA
jgi:O-acetyl-ADP-ribose deacetylase (regulator of RNase III)